MSWRGPLLAVTAALLGLPSAAAAASDFDHDVGREVLRQFAGCAVGANPDLAHRLVVAYRAEEFSMDQLVKVIDRRCFGFWRTNFFASDLAIRGTFAEALVRRGPRAWPALNPAGSAPLSWPVPASFRTEPGFQLTPEAINMMRARATSEAATGKLGECVVRASPQDAAYALATKPESKAEMTALKALTPQLAACMASGHNAKFSRPSLRYALAVSTYRMLAAQGALPAPQLSSKQGR